MARLAVKPVDGKSTQPAFASALSMSGFWRPCA
jgi:hypothetical protein